MVSVQLYSEVASYCWEFWLVQELIGQRFKVYCCFWLPVSKEYIFF
jgi:hypothetical protein